MRIRPDINDILELNIANIKNGVRDVSDNINLNYYTNNTASSFEILVENSGIEREHAPMVERQVVVFSVINELTIFLYDYIDLLPVSKVLASTTVYDLPISNRVIDTENKQAHTYIRGLIRG
jgi:hypothetical protein